MNKTTAQELRAGELTVIGRASGSAFVAEHLVTPVPAGWAFGWRGSSATGLKTVNR